MKSIPFLAASAEHSLNNLCVSRQRDRFKDVWSGSKLTLVAIGCGQESKIYEPVDNIATRTTA
jgi:hypothetical protein